MATLAVDTPRVFETGHDDMWADLPMIDNDIIYDGAAVGESGVTGTFRPLVSGDKFAGFCIEKADNTGTGHAAGAVNVRVKRRGRVVLPITLTAITDEGASVFATDDNVFTLTPSGTRIGRLARFISTTSGVVEFDTAISSTRVVVPFSLGLHATKTEYNIYTAPSACRVMAIKVTPDIVAGGALTATVVKCTGTATPVKTTTPMHTADAINLNATAHTVQAIALSSTVADLALVAGERIGLDLSGALTAGSANITIELELL
jgi:hypothetical protein